MLLIIILLSAIALFSVQPKGEPGTAVFKIKPEYRSLVNVGSNSCGIASVDEKLAHLKVSGIKQRFLTPKSAKHDIALIFSVSSALPAISIVNQLAGDKHIQYAEVVYPDELFAVPNDTEYAISQYFAALEAEAAWDIHKGELGANPVVLALTDTGCKWNHVDLAPNVWNNLGEDANSNGYTLYNSGSAWVMDAGDINGIDDDGNGKVDDLIGWDFMLNENGDEALDPYDGGGHGTAVSGIMDARTNNNAGTSSLAWNLTLMPISCSYTSGSIYKGYEAIIYAAENGADIINCSWGGNAFSQSNQEAIDYAWCLGSIIVAAAGNSNNQNPVYPAAYRHVLGIAALQNSGLKSTISSYGAFVDFGVTNSVMRTTALSGGYLTGNTGVNNATSYASPVVAALLGLVKSFYPALTSEEIVMRVKGSCDDVDYLNPSYVNLLGEGKINARRALEDVNPLPDNEIRLSLFEFQGINDANGNGAVEPYEMFTVNMRFRNHGCGSENATFTLYSSNSAVSVVSNTEHASIPEDDYFDLMDAFSIHVLPGAISQYVTFTLYTSADISVAVGQYMQFNVVINAGGVLVWEGINGSRNMSGTFIRNTLQGLGYPCVYGNSFPQSLYSFDAVYLSFGNAGSSITRFDKPSYYTALKDYLMSGGKLYIEGGDVVGYDMAALLPGVEGELGAHDILWQLLGIQSADDGTTNPIDNLTGLEASPTEGFSFSSTNQTAVTYIDTFTALSSYAKSAFEENGYGCVAVANTGAYGQRSFVFSYALSELADGSAPNTRANLLTEIVQFFESDTFLGELDSPQLSISVVGDSISLSWLAVPMADYYHVYLSDVPDAWTGVVPVVVYGTQYSLPPGEKAFFKVVAVAD